MEKDRRKKGFFLKRLLPLIVVIGMLCGQVMAVSAAEIEVEDAEAQTYETEDGSYEDLAEEPSDQLETGGETALAAKEFEGKTVILHSNDVHGSIAGYAKIAGLKKDFEEKGADVILADAGDYSQGSPYVSTTKGKDAVDMMNAAGYDVVTLGNHEFDYGYAQLVQNMSSAEFKVLCADVLDSNGNTIYDSHTIIESNGVKIGFFGLETPEAQTKANPALIQGLTFLAEKKMFAAAQNQVDALKGEGADIIICLAHLGVDPESAPNRSYDLTANTTGIDFVIDGHSHTVMTAGENGEKIQSTGTAFANVGVIVIDQATKSIENNYLIPVGEETVSDAAVAEAAQKIIARVDAEYGKVFAKAETELNGDKSPQGNRDSETNLGDLITDAMLWSVSQDAEYLDVPTENIVAVTNGGGIRAWIHVGDITKKDVNTVLPFGNTIAVVYVTGEDLLEALEASTYCTPYAIGGFPQVAGMEINIDTSKAYDANPETYPASTYYGPASINRVTIKSVNGMAFDPAATYAVVTNNFCAAGGDTYYAFASATSQFDTGIPLDEALMDYITTELNGVVTSEQYGETKGRITLAASCEHANTQREGAVEATCTESGLTGKLICVDCGAVLADSEVVEALGHSYGNDGICVRCGDKKVIGNTGNTGNTDKKDNAVSSGSKKNTPKTGDDSNAALYIILCAAAMAAVGCTAREKKRSRG
ncbi:MAG: bifunctional UDP-sugar hydrolase/5'-nucleotidase [Eubacteriales bacterium]|nr:bifunctional UDP-sugar hydrolase/5'-nucleotidase [Eubacteriales bacterium]